MFHIHLDPGNRPYFSYNYSIDSELRSNPLKALNGSKTKEEETDLFNFPHTSSHSNPTDNTNDSDIQTPERRDGFGYFDASDDAWMDDFPIVYARMEDSSHNPPQKLIQQTQAEVYPQEAFKSTEIESDMDTVNYFFGNDDFFKQNQVYQPHSEVLHPGHPVEQSQYHSPIMKIFVEPSMKPPRSNCDGNRIEESEINIVNPKQVDLDDDSGTLLKKKVCLDIGIPRQDQEAFSWKTQAQAMSQTLSQRRVMPSKTIFKTNTQRKGEALEMAERRQQAEPFYSCSLVNTFTLDDFIDQRADESNHVNATPFFTNETSFIEAKGHQLEQAPFIIPRIPDEQLSNSIGDIG